MKKILLAFTPFHTPASPPFGLACLKAAVETARPGVQVRTVDWNLAFFRRWLLGEMPDLCAYHPTRLLGTICPALVMESGIGPMILDDLCRIPQSAHEQERTMQAARLLDGIYNNLAGFYHDVLFPYVEQRSPLTDEAVDALFGAELAQVQAEQPQLVGFSILSEQNLLYSLALGRAIKERLGIPIALGGAMMSHLDAGELLQGFPWLDYIFFGEAEQSLVEFVDGWEDQQWEGVAGLAHRSAAGVCEHTRPSHLALDRLPAPDFGDFPLADYITPAPVLPIITSRGCYWGKCTFCSHTLPYGGGVRFRSAGQVVDEMETQMQRYGVRHFLFVDEAISPRTMRQLSQTILDRELDVRYGTEGVRVEQAFNEALLQQAHDSGLRWLYVGIESATQRLLDLIEKGTDIETTERFIETCRHLGIVPQLSFIVGLPSTTIEELQGEIEFMKRYPMDASSYVLLLGSPMHERPQDFGVRIEEQQVMYRTPAGSVHAPRFYFTVDRGLSPVQADAIVEAAGPMRKMRPHLGEVHATVLADTDFFRSEQRPPAPADLAEIALNVLHKQRAAGQIGRDWFLHILGCLENQGRLKKALTVAQAALASVPDAVDAQPALRLHFAALLNQAARHRQALQTLNGVAPESLPALRGERVRALFALEQYDQAGREIEAMLAAGFEMPWVYFILGQCYEATGEPGKALGAYRMAEQRDWYEPEVNEAQGRCLRALKRKTAARETQARALRKRRQLEQGAV